YIRGEKPEMEDLYFRVNRSLTVEVAKKAKIEGVKQFIFMSSMSVYGLEGKIGEDIVITKDTLCKPNTYYGKSKLDAENELRKLNNTDFIVAIVIAPMIYGPNCPGNYAHFKKLMVKVPIFPLINNKRSMLFIDNLSEFVRLLINNQDFGLFFPQNKEYVSTTELVKLIAKENGKKLYLSRLLGLIIEFLGKKITTANKVFGNLVFNSSISNYCNYNYCVVNLGKSVEICENK
ncbi:MAG: NAD-dependent epimerase/dehydratase family protein, partial [Parcubacteria group bacterium]|nr:NAD-dependent epimerase/dehydratase family protein [Parcubacteria group bacterium]